jgi:uncharacterized protein with HEPN domain
MPSERSRKYLQDILDSIDAIERFAHGMDEAAFDRDDKTQSAVERKMLIISEAAIRLKDEAAALCPGIPWHQVRGIGNWLRHQYDQIELGTVWDATQNDLPPLRAAVEQALKNDKQA